MGLVENLRELSEEVRRKSEAAQGNEANTREYLIKPFIAALGYDTAEPNDVAAEYTADLVKHTERADYALKKDGKPIMLVEFKAASEVLSRKHTVQLQRYINSKLDIRFGILTNGINYRFYADLDKPNVMDDQPFLMVDMLHLDNEDCNRLQLFTKSGFDVESCLNVARTLKYKRAIRQALRDELEPLSADLLRHFVRKACPGKLPPPKSSLRRELEGLVKQAWDEYTIEISRPMPDPAPPDPPPPPLLVSSDKLEIPVFAVYQGRRFKATLMIDDSMRLQREDNMLFDGKPMNHAVAAFEAVKKVDPLMKKSPTGWIFWRFIDSDTGNERPIKEIFEEVWTRNSSNGY